MCMNAKKTAFRYEAHRDHQPERRRGEDGPRDPSGGGLGAGGAEHRHAGSRSGLRREMGKAASAARRPVRRI